MRCDKGNETGNEGESKRLHFGWFSLGSLAKE